MKWSKWISLGVVGIGAIGSLAAISKVFFTYYDFGSADRQLSNELARYRSNRLPLLASELVDQSDSNGQNAAPAILEAIRKMPPKKVESKLLKDYKTQDGAAKDVVEPYAESLAMLQLAVNRSSCDFKRDWDLGPHLLLPEYASMKTLCRAASARALLSAKRGDDTAALRDLTLARQLGVWAGQEPSLISFLVRIANESIALNSIEKCLGAASENVTRIRRYQAWLAQAPAMPKFGTALRGEAFLGVTVMRNLDGFGGINALTRLSEDGEGVKPVDPGTIIRSGLPQNSHARAFLSRHLAVWNEAFASTNGFANSAPEIGKQLDRIAQRLDHEKGLSYVLERILLPVFGQAGEATTQLEARRAVQAGLAQALAIHAQSGSWPSAVNIVDPFSKSPIHVKHDGAHLRVYSVGRDRKDNGGLSKREVSALGSTGEDVVAAFPSLAR